MNDVENDVLSDGELGERDGGARLVAELEGELRHCYAAGSEILERRRLAGDWRYCRWPGQHEDGRRHEAEDGVAPFPFEGAPDTRIHLVDSIVNENVDVLSAAFWLGRIQAEATSFAGLKQSGYVSLFLDWLRGNALLAQLTKEVELLANIQEGDDPGLAILGVFWEPRLTTRWMEASPEMLTQMALAQGVELDAAFWDGGAGGGQLLLNGSGDELGRADARVGMLMGLVPELSTKGAERGLRDWDSAMAGYVGDEGDDLPLIRLALPEDKGLPRFRALRPGEDVWLDWDADDVQECRGVFMREELNELELRLRVETMGYDADWVEAVLRAGHDYRAFVSWGVEQAGSSRDWANADFAEAHRTFEVWRCYRKVFNALTGASELRVTVFSVAEPELVALDVEVEDTGGLYPFIEFRREHLARGLLESRGVSRVAGTGQHEIKVLRDCRATAVQLATLPPVKHRVLRGVIGALAPGRAIPVRDMGDFDWMSPPPFPNQSLEMERNVRQDLDDYFGRVRPDGAPSRGFAVQQKMVNKWLNCWAAAWQLALRLCQRNMQPERIAAALSVRLGEEVLPDLDGEYSLTLSFDARNLDIEFVKEKLGLIQAILPMDRMGLLDMGMVADMMHAVDPMLARSRVRDVSAATEQEANEERVNLSQMAVGMEPPMRDSGQNFELRLRTLQEEMQKSPKLMEQYQGDESFRGLVDNRMKHLGFMVQQGQNAVTGRVGAQPVQGGGAGF